MTLEVNHADTAAKRLLVHYLCEFAPSNVKYLVYSNAQPGSIKCPVRVICLLCTGSGF